MCICSNSIDATWNARGAARKQRHTAVYINGANSGATKKARGFLCAALYHVRSAAPLINSNAHGRLKQALKGRDEHIFHSGHDELYLPRARQRGGGIVWRSVARKINGRKQAHHVVQHACCYKGAIGQQSEATAAAIGLYAKATKAQAGGGHARPVARPRKATARHRHCFPREGPHALQAAAIAHQRRAGEGIPGKPCQGGAEQGRVGGHCEGGGRGSIEVHAAHHAIEGICEVNKVARRVESYAAAAAGPTRAGARTIRATNIAGIRNGRGGRPRAIHGSGAHSNQTQHGGHDAGGEVHALQHGASVAGKPGAHVHHVCKPIARRDQAAWI